MVNLIGGDFFTIAHIGDEKAVNVQLNHLYHEGRRSEETIEALKAQWLKQRDMIQEQILDPVFLAFRFYAVGSQKVTRDLVVTYIKTYSPSLLAAKEGGLLDEFNNSPVQELLDKYLK